MKHSPKTWWGEVFVSALEGFIDSGRLQRGKAYRTDRRILSFDMTQNQINARVLGNANAYFGVDKAPTYKISINFKTIGKKDWDNIIKKIAANPSWLAKLMLKEVPANIEDAFAGSYLLPTSFEDINADCSCPDYANPCKHIAGVYYKIANLLDSNPMLLFELRGLDAKALIKALEKSEFGQVFANHLAIDPDITLAVQTQRYRPFLATNEVKRTSVENIWLMKAINNDAAALSASPQSNTPSYTMPACLVKKQGDYPEFWSSQRSFIAVMEGIYTTIKRKNIKQLS